MDNLLERETKQITEPPKRWRNWWMAVRKCHCYCGNATIAGEKYSGCQCGNAEDGPFASRDIAETVAESLLLDPTVFYANKYLGAYPEGERP